jgi:hypothetical protein
VNPPFSLPPTTLSGWPMPAALRPAKKNSTKPPPRGTPRGNRPLGRPAGRTLRRSLYPCASGHTSRSHGLQPMDPKYLRLRHPTETQEKPKKTQEKPTETQEKPAAGVPCPSAHVLSRSPAKSGRPAPRMVQSLVSVPI